MHTGIAALLSSSVSLRIRLWEMNSASIEHIAHILFLEKGSFIWVWVPAPLARMLSIISCAGGFTMSCQHVRQTPVRRRVPGGGKAKGAVGVGYKGTFVCPTNPKFGC